MVCYITNIQQQVTKLKHILTDLCEKYPQTTQLVDNALFCSIKIEKLLNKARKATEQQPQHETLENQRVDYTDSMFTEAAEMIDKFKHTTSKLSKKINIFVNETYFKHRPSPSPEQHKQKKRSCHRSKKKWEESIEDGGEDSSIKRLDAEIAEIVEQIYREEYEDDE